MRAPPLTVAFKAFGCRLNQAEAAQFESGFRAAGAERVPFGAPARVIVLHSCAVTRKAEGEGLKLLRALRARFPDAFLVLSGCTVEACGPEALRALGADLAVPREQRDRLVTLVLQRLGLPAPTSAAAPPPPSTQRALLKVQDGCDFFCAYCIVPHTRGRPVSRPAEECLAEARALAGAGFRELVVTGCNIACYRDGTRSLVDLLQALAAQAGGCRIRLGSIEPGTVERDVIALMAETPALCRYLHLPVQSADDAVLARMGRRYTAGHVLDTLRLALARLPGIGLGADFICGFPGEGEAAFARTLELAREVPLSNLHVFPYSERPGTPAAGFDGRVPPAERRRRASLLIEQGRLNRAAFAESKIGRPAAFVVERYDARGRACGWSAEYLPCAVRGVAAGRRRQLVTFTPDAARDGTLEGAAEQPQAGA